MEGYWITPGPGRWIGNGPGRIQALLTTAPDVRRLWASLGRRLFTEERLLAIRTAPGRCPLLLHGTSSSAGTPAWTPALLHQAQRGGSAIATIHPKPPLPFRSIPGNRHHPRPKQRVPAHDLAPLFAVACLQLSKPERLTNVVKIRSTLSTGITCPLHPGHASLSAGH
jgi:hypothetical protein